MNKLNVIKAHELKWLITGHILKVGSYVSQRTAIEMS